MESEYNGEIAPLLRNLSAVICASISLGGKVIDSNKGFNFIANLDGDSPQLWNVQSLFIQPQFSEFLADEKNDGSKPIYQGILNIGDPATTTRSVNGVVYRIGKILFLMAEFDIVDYERLAATVLELNDELAQAQRDLVKVNQKLKRNEKRLEKLMLTDPLTQIANRRSYDLRLKQEIERFQRYDVKFCLALADIDLFKSVNDKYGHDVGDVVIQVFAKVLEEHSRNTDFVARIGGEEFIVLLPETELEGAFNIIDRLRELFSMETFETIDHPLTASFGLTHSLKDDTVDTIFKRVDLALYEAKETGRNKVIRLDINKIN